MDLTMADQFYLKAIDEFPYDLASTVENLNYAISYDDEHCPALCLMGQVFMYHVKQYKKADYYFNRSLCSDLNYLETFKHLILLKIWLSDFNGAIKIIDYAHKIKGVNKALLFSYRATIHECTGELKQCEITLKKARDYCMDEEFEKNIKQQLMRVKAKVKRNRKASKKGVTTSHVVTP